MHWQRTPGSALHRGEVEPAQTPHWLRRGANVGHALGEILRAAALRLAEGGPEDFRYGALLWPNIVATVSDCATSPVRRNNVLFGSQLHLEG